MEGSPSELWEFGPQVSTNFPQAPGEELRQGNQFNERMHFVNWSVAYTRDFFHFLSGLVILPYVMVQRYLLTESGRLRQSSAVPTTNLQHSSTFRPESSPQSLDVTPRIEFLSQHRQGSFRVQSDSKSSGTVYHATYEGKYVSVKMLGNDWNKDRIHEIVARPRHYKAFFREIKVWQSMPRHENVLHLIGYYFNVESVEIGLVWPLERENLRSWASNCQGDREADSIRLKFLCQCATGLHHLHHFEPPILHGDLRASNIVITSDGTAKVADYGITHLNDAYFTNSSGDDRDPPIWCLPWMAPELLRNSRMRGTKYSDLFSFAQLVIEVFTGNDPFGGQHSTSSELKSYMLREGRPHRPEGLPVGLWPVMEKYWGDRPQERGSIQDVINVFVEMDRAGVITSRF